MTLRRAYVLVAWSLVGSYGCYRAQEPDGADTNTNWLECDTDLDCRGGARCVAHECTDATDGEQVTAATGSDTSDASAVGASAVPVPSSSGAPAWSPGENESFVISDPTRQAGAPTVRFIHDHFTVAFTTGTAEGPDDRLDLVHVFDGQLQQDWRPYPHPLTRVAIAGDGSLAVIPHGQDGSTCLVDHFTSRLEAQRESLNLPCADGLVAASAAGDGEEWLIASSDADEVQIGRYASARREWTVAPSVVGMRGAANVLAITAGARDAFVVWGSVASLDGGDDPAPPLVGTSMAMRVRGVAADPPEPSTLDLLPFSASSHPDGSYGFAEIAGRALLFGMDGANLWSVALVSVGGDDSHHAVHEVATSAIIDRRPGVAAMSETGRVAICYATGPGPEGGALGRQDGVSLVITNADGIPLVEPRVIASGLYNMGGCDIAWSGAELLVVWWDIDLEAEPRVSVIRGLRVRAPS